MFRVLAKLPVLLAIALSTYCIVAPVPVDRVLNAVCRLLMLVRTLVKLLLMLITSFVYVENVVTELAKSLYCVCRPLTCVAKLPVLLLTAVCKFVMAALVDMLIQLPALVRLLFTLVKFVSRFDVLDAILAVLLLIAVCTSVILALLSTTEVNPVKEPCNCVKLVCRPLTCVAKLPVLLLIEL